MKLGKNKKKQWRKCAPGIEDEIIKANQLKEIEDVSFNISDKAKSSEIKYSTVPRTIVKRQKIHVKRDIINVYAADYDNGPALSKRRAEMMKNKIKYKQPELVIPSGISYNPPKRDHKDLLEMLAKDQILKIKDQMKNTIKIPKVPEVEPEVKDEVEEEETMEIEGIEMPKKAKILTTKQKRQKLANLKSELHFQKQKSKEKKEVQDLRNIPKISKEIKTTIKQQKERNEILEIKQKQRKADKAFREQISSVPFQLQSERVSCLRKLTPQGDLLGEMCDRLKTAHGFKSRNVKAKKTKKLTKMVKKNKLD